MARGRAADGDGRLHRAGPHHEPRRGGPARHGVQPDERRARGPGQTSRRDLVANVSHELKTPITAIRAHLENLLDGVEQPDPETLQVMLAQSERLGRLVDQLLDLSRLESGEVPLRPGAACRSRPLVTQVISEIDVARADRGVAVSSDVPDDLPPVDADRERVHQVLFNLVDNAIRFTPAGGAVRIEAHRHDGSRGGQRRRHRASGSPPSTCPGCSSGSTGSTAPGRGRRRRHRHRPGDRPFGGGGARRARSAPRASPATVARSRSISRSREAAETTGGP